MAKLDFVPYQTSPLASSAVGTPGSDTSGLQAATNELSDTAAVASSQLTANNRVETVLDAITGSQANYAQQGINAYENAKAQAQAEMLRQEEKLRQESAKAIADDIGSGYELQAAQAVKQILSDPEIMRNPDKAPKAIEQKLADLYDGLPEMDSEVGRIVHAKYNNIRVDGGKAAEEFRFKQRVENAKKAVVNADTRRIDYGVEAAGGDLTQLEGLVRQVDEGMDGRESAQGAEQAQKTAIANKEGMGKKFLLLAVQNAPNMMPVYLSDPVIQSIVPQDDRNKFDEQAKAKIKALTLEANQAQKAATIKTENNRFQLYAHAFSSDDPAKIQNTIELFTATLDELGKDTTGDEDIRRQEKDMVAWIKDLRGRIDHKEAIARTEANFAKAEHNADVRAQKALDVQKAKDEKVKALNYLLTEDAQNGKAQAMEAYYAVRGKEKDAIVKSRGGEEEHDQIITAMAELRRAYNKGQLGVKSEAGTVTALNTKMTYLQRRLELNEKKNVKVEGQNTWDLGIKQLQSLIVHHEAENPPLPKVVATHLNPTGDKKQQQALELKWADDHPKIVSEYRRQNGLDPNAPLKMSEYKVLMEAHGAQKLLGKK